MIVFVIARKHFCLSVYPYFVLKCLSVGSIFNVYFSLSQILFNHPVCHTVIAFTTKVILPETNFIPNVSDITETKRHQIIFKFATEFYF